VTRRIEPLAKGRRIAVRHEPGRVCAVSSCDTQLSIYNGSDLCSLHEAPRDKSPYTTATGSLLRAIPAAR